MSEEGGVALLNPQVAPVVRRRRREPREQRGGADVEEEVMRRQAKRQPSRGVGDELQNRWESIVARERRYEAGVDKLRAPRASGPRGIHTTTASRVRGGDRKVRREVRPLL